jgi:hypothetical protein
MSKYNAGYTSIIGSGTCWQEGGSQEEEKEERRRRRSYQGFRFRIWGLGFRVRAYLSMMCMRVSEAYIVHWVGA